MKLLRLLPALGIGLAATLAVLAVLGVRATEASGSVTTCDDAHFSTALSGGGLVTFNCGGAATISAAAVHTIGISTTIDGSNNGQPLTLTAASGVQLFYVQSGATLTLTNLMIAGVNYGSGPVYVLQGGLVVSHSQFISNATGAIYSNGPVTVTNSVFRATRGSAALLVVATGSLSVDNSQFISNTAGSITSYAPVTVSNSTFYSNTTLGAAGGGGIDLEATSRPLTLTVTSSQFMSNTSYSGASIYANGGAVTISNTLFVSNTNTGGAGAGMWYQPFNSINNLQVLSSTFRLNVNGAIAINGGAGTPMTIADSTFSDNLGPQATAGVASSGMALTISHSSFIHNVTTANDPGSLNAGGPVYITGSLFENNVGQFGGAMYLGNGGSPIFTDTVANTSILSNTSVGWDGGGIDALVPLIVSDSIISGNVMAASGHAGGGLSWSSFGNNLTIRRSLFYANQAPNNGSGGGLSILGNITIVNSTVFSNTSTNGGGVYVGNSSSVTLTNDTLAGNTASGLVSTYGNLYNGSITPAALVNTLLAGGSPKNCGGAIVSLGHNLSSDATCPLTATGDLSGTNPLLGPLQNNGGPSFTLLPTAASPAVNSGDNANCPADDQRGVARFLGSACDIGAVETPYKTAQTINFGALLTQTTRTASIPVSASANSSLVVSFSSLTPGVCAVSGTIVTLLAGGTCTVRASQAGNSVYAAAPDVDRSFLIFDHFLFVPLVVRGS